jgi:flagellar hook protein FlgE
VTDEIVKLRLEERNAQANVRTLQTADQVVGSLINTTA